MQTVNRDDSMMEMEFDKVDEYLIITKRTNNREPRYLEDLILQDYEMKLCSEICRNLFANDYCYQNLP